jgi:hypothetical protein
VHGPAEDSRGFPWGKIRSLTDIDRRWLAASRRSSMPENRAFWNGPMVFELAPAAHQNRAGADRGRPSRWSAEGLAAASGSLDDPLPHSPPAAWRESRIPGKGKSLPGPASMASSMTTRTPFIAKGR